MIHIGVAGWDYPDWAGLVYPSPRPRPFDRLAWLSGFLDAVEINVTFYRRVDAEIANSWISRVRSNSSFAFTAKLYRVFTHDPETDLVDEARRYRDSIGPLLGSGRLKAVLVQFPHSFHDRPGNRARLARIVDLLPGLPLVAEFRHRSWDNERAVDFLRELRVGFCNIDQPALGSTLPPTEHVTSSVGYVRLHGRNAGHWFARQAARAGISGGSGGGSARYDYLYSLEELRPWVDRIGRIAARAEETVVIANNHYRGKAPANALMLKGALTGRRAQAPAPLIAAYPELGTVADPVAPPARHVPKQGRLF
jgi:uncharacterized protein YecE (DUF72 family)